MLIVCIQYVNFCHFVIRHSDVFWTSIFDIRVFPEHDFPFEIKNSFLFRYS